jgi:excinuclease UvrABC ATPase subunit
VNTSFKLRDLDVMFPVGELSVVCGATGSGKVCRLDILLLCRDRWV